MNGLFTICICELVLDICRFALCWKRTVSWRSAYCHTPVTMLSETERTGRRGCSLPHSGCSAEWHAEKKEDEVDSEDAFLTVAGNYAASGMSLRQQRGPITCKCSSALPGLPRSSHWFNPLSSDSRLEEEEEHGRSEQSVTAVFTCDTEEQTKFSLLRGSFIFCFFYPHSCCQAPAHTGLCWCLLFLSFVFIVC